MTCYCANYYGSINCRNTVNRFGERCKLCLVLKSGASLSEGLLPEDSPYMMTPPQSAESRTHVHTHTHGSRSRQDSAHGVGRSGRGESRFKS